MRRGCGRSTSLHGWLCSKTSSRSFVGTGVDCTASERAVCGARTIKLGHVAVSISYALRVSCLTDGTQKHEAEESRPRPRRIHGADNDTAHSSNSLCSFQPCAGGNRTTRRAFVAGCSRATTSAVRPHTARRPQLLRPRTSYLARGLVLAIHFRVDGNPFHLRCVTASYEFCSGCAAGTHVWFVPAKLPAGRALFATLA